MSETETHLIKNALRQIPEKVDHLQQSFRGLQARLRNGATYEEGVREILGFIYESLHMGEQALDEAFVTFLEACQDAGLNPNDFLDNLQTELRSALIPFHVLLGLMVEDVFSGEKQSVRKQKEETITNLVKMQLRNLIDERYAEARGGFHKGRLIWRKEAILGGRKAHN